MLEYMNVKKTEPTRWERAVAADAPFTSCPDPSKPIMSLFVTFAGGITTQRGRGSGSDLLWLADKGLPLLALPLLLAPAPRLDEVVLLGVAAPAGQARLQVFVPLPVRAPFGHRHHLHAMAERRVDLHGVPRHDLAPLHLVHGRPRRSIHVGLHVRPHVLQVVWQVLPVLQVVHLHPLPHHGPAPALSRTR